MLLPDANYLIKELSERIAELEKRIQRLETNEWYSKK